jgi:hypothetical protein
MSIRITRIAMVGTDNAEWLAAQRPRILGLGDLPRVHNLGGGYIGLDDDQYEALVERGEDEAADGGIHGGRIWIEGDGFALRPAPDDATMLEQFGIWLDTDFDGGEVLFRGAH